MRRSIFSNCRLFSISILVLAISVFSCSPKEVEDLTLPEKVDFNYHIRPILSNNCFVCHGPDPSTREAKLRLDNFAGATAPFEDRGAAVVPGKVHKSLLIDRITSDDPELIMPPPEAKKSLSTREIALLKRWIKQGAEWKPHWAFINPKMPTLPEEVQQASAEKTIDYLIDKALESKGLGASSLADKNTLIRRVAYLLTGLPPTPEELEAFLSNTGSDAYEKMVDQYLASPQFGERWARHWMDLVRYGEGMGHEFDFPISAAWQYRDYLIRAFNQDVPYDLFVKEHLAGDMLENPRYHPEEDFNESILGTGYFFLGEGKHSPVNVKQEEADRIDNMIDVTSKTFQALTVACARCHDHKFDPIPTADYYAMYGMIESARIGPLPARRTRQQQTAFGKLKEISGEIQSSIGEQMMASADQPAAQFIKQQKQFINNLNQQSSSSPEEGDHRLIVDFRQGTWDGWYTNGWAFGEGPVMGKPVIDQGGKVRGLKAGVASSRYWSTGIQGALRSPNFMIEHDSMVIRAAGKGSTIRLIADNFQIIRNPLYGSLEHVVDDEQMREYVLDLTLVKGHKAYLEFLPGNYGKKTNAHVYRIQPEDYIEVEYAVAFNTNRPKLPAIPTGQAPGFSPKAKKEAVIAWLNREASTDQILLLDQWLQQSNIRLEKETFSALAGQFEQLSSQLYDSTHFLGLSEGEAVFSPVFIRGSINTLGEEKIPRKFLSAVKAGPENFPQVGSGRLAWAESLTDPANPLTSRVMVNRIWHHLFGRGIVETVDVFGLQGKLPSHPELLDYLALRFIEDGWSVKSMIKNILLSSSFQRSTEPLEANQDLDPENIFLHHFPVRRLEGEAIRDGILAVSGTLNLEMYGPPVPVHLNDFMTGRGRPRESGPLDGFGRRSVYTAIRRNFLPSIMLVFDMPIPFSTFGRRNVTNVPAQSLTLMNDPFIRQEANRWAVRLLEDKGVSVEERVNTIYLKAFSRMANAEEVHEAIALLEQQAKTFEGSLSEMKDDARLWTEFCHAIFNLKEFIHLL